MPLPVPDLSKINFEAILRHFDFAGAAREFAEQTPNVVDDFVVAQFAETLQEAFYALFRKTPIMMNAAPMEALTREQKRARILELATARGVTLSPTLIALLLQFAWPLIEKILDGLKK